MEARVTAAALLSVLTALAAERPVLVAVDDVQWLDAASALALGFVARRLPPRVGLLLTRRGEGGMEAPLGLSGALPEARVNRLVAGPLSLAALHHLIRSRLGTSMSHPLLARLVDASGGNPFFALEIARALERDAGDGAASGGNRATRAELPSGTLTFLFTDIEGSTRLLGRLGERYGSVLSDHQRLLRDAFSDACGREIDTQGDAFLAVFPRAKDAVAAALAAQRGLANHAWPADVHLRVRMGLHTGEPSAVRDRYIGLAVHRAARICAAGHGGQVLLSGATYAILADDVLPDMTFQDLGQHRLKDIDHAERIYQLLVPDLPRHFPPLRTLSQANPEALPQSELAHESADAPPTAGRRALRVVVADDSVLVREGLSRLLAEAGFDVVARAADADELLRQVGRAHDSHAHRGTIRCADRTRACPVRTRRRGTLR